MTNSKFSELFKKYRLRAEFDTLSSFGAALAEKGLIYEDSIYSHWQNGTRIPPERKLLLKIIEIFIQRKAINSLDEANKFLAAAHQGYLTPEEISKLPPLSSSGSPFQVPREIANFTGREEIIENVKQAITKGGILLLHGTSGVGKTALAIQISHEMKQLFPDGILWYRADNADPMDILLSIAYTFHENISLITDLNARASFVRSLLANKKVLLILDNIDPTTNLHVLLPNSTSTVILTSTSKNLLLNISYESIEVAPFSEKEVLELFENILGNEYVKKYKESLLQLAQKTGNLPLALHLYAKQLDITKQSPQSLIKIIESSKTSLQDLTYEDKNLYVSIDLSYKSLDEETKNVFKSLSIFAGNDFSLSAVAALNKISKIETLNVVQKLLNASLIETSTENRYRLHPFIKQYINWFTIDKEMYSRAGKYYTEFLEKNRRKNTKFFNANSIYPEIENILSIFQQCIQLGMYKETISIWKNLGMFFWITNQAERNIKFGREVYSLTKSHDDYYNLLKYSIDILARTLYLTGNFNEAQDLHKEGLTLALNIKNNYFIAYYESRLGKVYQTLLQLDKSIPLLTHSLESMQKYNDDEEISYTSKFLAEAYMFKRDSVNALYNLQNALKIAKKNQDTFLLTDILSKYGAIYFTEKEFTKAKKHLAEAIRLEKVYSIRMGIGVYGNLVLALIAKKENQMDKAKKYLDKAREENIYLPIKDSSVKVYSISSLLRDDLKQAGYYIFE